MKIGIISDVHGNDIALKAVIDRFKNELVEGIIYLGDLVAGGPNPKNTLELLKHQNIVSWIKGNTDCKYEEILMNNDHHELQEYYLYALGELSYEDLEYLTNKPKQEVVTLKGYDILCVHGSPRNIMEKMGKEVDKDKLLMMIEGVKSNIILCGHSHFPSIVELDDKVVVNAGSVGFPIDGDNRASYVILDINKNGYCFDFKRVEYNIENIINDARTKRLPELEEYEETIKTAKSLEE